MQVIEDKASNQTLCDINSLNRHLPIGRKLDRYTMEKIILMISEVRISTDPFAKSHFSSRSAVLHPRSLI